MSVDGILLVDKSVGWSSHDVVAKVRSTLRRAMSNEQRATSKAVLITQDSQLKTRSVKVGHTGTLDPLASGLLVLVIGSYCKRAAEFSKLDKTYEVTMKLGETSTTGDSEGTKKAVSSRRPAVSEIKEALQSFIGEIEQTPPAYSAIKVDGQRAYKLARAGKEVSIEPRQVTIHSIELNNYDYPLVDFTTHVSSGTYIRSLVEDIGRELGTGAYMSDLIRTQVGQFDLKNAVQPDKVLLKHRQHDALG